MGFVSLMADYCSSGLWDEDGLMIDGEDLPISPELRQDIADWALSYEPSEFYLALHERKRVFDTPDFNDRGGALAERLRAELPDWHVEHLPEDDP